MSSVTDRLKKRASAVQTGSEREVLIPIDKIKFDPSQPRKAFHSVDGIVAQNDLLYIEELAQSIKENGLIQPITVQEQEDGVYLVVVGECRTRAHLLLGQPTIRAIVRNDLTNPSRRLVYQIAENVNRQDLSDEELAISIRHLLESGDDGKPMSQVAVARQLGKSEPWVSRFVKYGDEELQRVWVKSGIADSVEKVYRLSLLPKPVQMEILSRVDLPEGDPNRIEKPILRSVIDQITTETKAAKAKNDFRANLDRKPSTTPVPEAATPVSDGKDAGSEDGGKVSGTAGGYVIGNDPIDLAIQASLEDSMGENAASVNGPDDFPSNSEERGYSLSEEVRQAILSKDIIDSSHGATISTEEAKLAPVHCRVSVRNMEAFLKLMADDPDHLDFARSIRCDLIIPGTFAGVIANKLAGVVVDAGEVAAVVQNKLVMLEV